jgi:DNA polymerase-1
LQDSVIQIEKSVIDWKPNMIQNLIFDGNNLAHRVMHAMKTMPHPLTDKEGNPTSVVFGFLKSLSSLKKRFDKANIYVVWDGSKKRRSVDYPEYKANRPEMHSDLYSQMCTLKKLLPLFGVYQVWNPEEETDDMIACLVRNPLKGSRNVIVSTDRDFLQLVTHRLIVDT